MQNFFWNIKLLCFYEYIENANSDVTEEGGMQFLWHHIIEEEVVQKLPYFA